MYTGSWVPIFPEPQPAAGVVQFVDFHRVGYAITDPKKYLDFELKKYELEPLKDDRVTVAVEVCGVCGSVSSLLLWLRDFVPLSPSLVSFGVAVAVEAFIVDYARMLI